MNKKEIAMPKKDLQASLYSLDFVMNIFPIKKIGDKIKTSITITIFNTNRYDEIKKVFEKYNYKINKFEVSSEKSYLHIKIEATQKLPVNFYEFISKVGTSNQKGIYKKLLKMKSFIKFDNISFSKKPYNPMHITIRLKDYNDLIHNEITEIFKGFNNVISNVTIEYFDVVFVEIKAMEKIYTSSTNMIINDG